MRAVGVLQTLLGAENGRERFAHGLCGELVSRRPPPPDGVVARSAVLLADHEAATPAAVVFPKKNQSTSGFCFVRARIYSWTGLVARTFAISPSNFFNSFLV